MSRNTRTAGGIAGRASASWSSSLFARFGAAAELLFFGRGVAAEATVVGSDFSRAVFGAVVGADERSESVVFSGSGASLLLSRLGRLTAYEFAVSLISAGNPCADGASGPAPGGIGSSADDA